MSVEAILREVPKGQPPGVTTQNEIKLSCADCGHKIREEWEMPIEAGEFARRMKSLCKCKVCGSKKINMGWPASANT